MVLELIGDRPELDVGVSITEGEFRDMEEGGTEELGGSPGRPGVGFWTTGRVSIRRLNYFWLTREHTHRYILGSPFSLLVLVFPRTLAFVSFAVCVTSTAGDAFVVTGHAVDAIAGLGKHELLNLS